MPEPAPGQPKAMGTLEPGRIGTARGALIWFALAAAIVILDRVTKLVVLSEFVEGESRFVTGFFNLVLVYNKGAAFSFLAGASGWQTPLLAAIALGAAALVSVLLLRSGGQGRLYCLGLALILGGALGNLWDRLEWGQVLDFLDFHVGGWHWPAFNVADAAITVGAASLIADSFWRGRDGG